MSRKRVLSFRTDYSPTGFEFEDGEVYRVDPDGARQPVTDPELRASLLRGAAKIKGDRESLVSRITTITRETPDAYENYTEKQLRQILEAHTSGSAGVRGRKLTVGSLLGKPPVNPVAPPGVHIPEKKPDEPKPGLTVGDLLGKRQNE